MGELNLETNPDGIVSLFTGDMKDEAAAKVVQYAVGNLPSFCLHVKDKNIPNNQTILEGEQRKATMFATLTLANYGRET